MSRTTWTALVSAALACGCATGTNTNGGQNIDAAVQPHHDDAPKVTGDAPVVKMDAAVVRDAPPDAPPDAASSLFCSSNSECTTAGQCCLILGQPPGLCTNGQVVLGVCLPQ